MVTCSAIMTMGRLKHIVFPLPVKAIPIMSRPDSTAGSPWIWIGVGRMIFFAASASMMACGALA